MCILLTHTFCLMCHAQKLELTDNNIGAAGLTAFAKAVESGALAPGANVFLRGNSATETGKQAIRDAAKARDLSVHFLVLCDGC